MPSILSKAAAFAGMVKVEHTLFALPFAFAGAILAAEGWPEPRQVLWITMAMIGARNAAMGLNRILDRHIDARNPRTRDRHLPAGKIAVGEAWAFTLAFFALLAFSAWRLNTLCLALLPLAVAALVVYPYAKRFTWTCHYWMVPAQFFAPFGGWIAVTGRVEMAPVLLGLGVGLWIAGFDLFYALQDLEFDREAGVHSLPARFGVNAGLWAARATHVAAVGLFLAAGWVLGLGPAYAAGVAAAAGLLAYQHFLVGSGGTEQALRAFNINLAVGPVVLAGILVQVFGV